MNEFDDFLKGNPSLNDSHVLSEKELGQLYGGGHPGDPGCTPSSVPCSKTCSGKGSSIVCSNGCSPSCSGSAAGNIGPPR